MRLLFSDLFKTESQKKFKIAASDARDTVLHYDTLSVHELEEIKLDFYLKKLKQGNYHLLVCSHWESKVDNLLIDLAFKLPTSFVEEAQTADPLKLLQYFVSHFGYELEIGSQRSRFIFNETIPIDPKTPDTKLVRVLGAGEQGICNMFIKPKRTSSGAFVDCALAYCIDAGKYRAWIDPKF